MNYFQDALRTHRSTILYGSFGRYPQLCKFYLDAIPELEAVSDFELLFWYRRRRFLKVLLEPAFHAHLPSHEWLLVLTSHVQLSYEPKLFRMVTVHVPLIRSIPAPLQTARNQQKLVPPTCHTGIFFDRDVTTPYQVDLSSIDTPHEAYLRLLTFLDVLEPCTLWSLSIPPALRVNLLKEIPKTGVYDSY